MFESLGTCYQILGATSMTIDDLNVGTFLNELLNKFDRSFFRRIHECGSTIVVSCVQIETARTNQIQCHSHFIAFTSEQ
jgi:hypothetical protein